MKTTFKRICEIAKSAVYGIWLGIWAGIAFYTVKFTYDTWLVEVLNGQS